MRRRDAGVGAFKGLVFGVAPLLEAIVVGCFGFPGRRAVVRYRMGAAEEMLSRTDFPKGVQRQLVLIDRGAGEIGVQRGAMIRSRMNFS